MAIKNCEKYQAEKRIPKCPWELTQTRPCCWAAARGMYHAAEGVEELPVGSFCTESSQKLNSLMKSDIGNQR